MAPVRTEWGPEFPVDEGDNEPTTSRNENIIPKINFRCSDNFSASSGGSVGSTLAYLFVNRVLPFRSKMCME
jgi:hypothetical protein